MSRLRSNLHRKCTVLGWVLARFHESLHVILQGFFLAVLHRTTLLSRLGWILHVVVLHTVFGRSVLDMTFVRWLQCQVLGVIFTFRRTVPGCSRFAHKFRFRFHLDLEFEILWLLAHCCWCWRSFRCFLTRFLLDKHVLRVEFTVYRRSRRSTLRVDFLLHIS